MPSVLKASAATSASPTPARTGDEGGEAAAAGVTVTRARVASEAGHFGTRATPRPGAGALASGA
ncbi:hypothetical protein GCM10025871_10760 [Deinococcus metallilatus]|nr:hypothetical protein GCM10025871_10760 [Deinococcus metallilatus]